jgi:hypothetical protein
MGAAAVFTADLARPLVTATLADTAKYRIAVLIVFEHPDWFEQRLQLSVMVPFVMWMWRLVWTASSMRRSWVTRSRVPG